MISADFPIQVATVIPKHIKLLPKNVPHSITASMPSKAAATTDNSNHNTRRKELVKRTHISYSETKTHVAGGTTNVVVVALMGLRAAHSVNALPMPYMPEPSAQIEPTVLGYELGHSGRVG
eukprot:scaffold26620_cov160-Skeletonema_menzelii.AAC.4